MNETQQLTETLNRLNETLQLIFVDHQLLRDRVSALEAKSSYKSDWVNHHAAMEILGCRYTRLNAIRKEHWTEGIHFVRHGGQRYQYNPEALRDWQMNRNNPMAHNKFIAQFRKRRTAKL